MYQGYTNYETWAVSLWLNNDEGDYNRWWDRANELVEENEGDKDQANRDLADEIQASVEEANPVSDSSSLYSDIMTNALGSVDWREVAESFIEDVEYTPEEEDRDEQ